MENIPKIVQSTDVSFEIDINPYMIDHQFLGNAVLPAVEAMQVLARTAIDKFPFVKDYCIVNANFLRFLLIEENKKKIKAINELKIDANERVYSTLITINKLKGGTITRKKEHVKIEFAKTNFRREEFIFDDIKNLSGDIFSISSVKIYKELVPFLKSYHNITGDILLTEAGAVAEIKSPDFNIDDGPLGSPFVFDAAFHAACVWGQRYTGIVGFPVGFHQRQIVKPAKSNEKYISRILPVKQNDRGNVFDICIYDTLGFLHEIIYGVFMKDVSMGKMQPPQWIKKES